MSVSTDEKSRELTIRLVVVALLVSMGVMPLAGLVAGDELHWIDNRTRGAVQKGTKED